MGRPLPNYVTETVINPVTFQTINNATNELISLLNQFEPVLTSGGNIQLITVEGIMIEVIPDCDELVFRMILQSDQDNNEEVIAAVSAFIFENTNFGQLILKGFLSNQLNAKGIISGFSEDEKAWLLKMPNQSYFLITAENSEIKVTQYLKQT